MCDVPRIWKPRTSAARRTSPTEELLKLGASAVIDTSDLFHSTLPHAIMELTNGTGAAAAVDSAGGASGTALAQGLRPGGVLLNIGLLSGIPLSAAEIARGTKAQLKLFHLRHWNERTSAGEWQQTFRRLIRYVSDHRLRLQAPGERYDLSEVNKAVLAARTRRGNGGKIFLTS